MANTDRDLGDGLEQQLEIAIVRSSEVDHHDAEVRRLLRIAIRDHIGLERAAKLCGAHEQDLVNALNGRKGRHVRVAWLWRLANDGMVPAELKQQIVDAITIALGCEGAKPVVKKTADQRLAELLAELREEHGKNGKRLAEKYSR